MKVTRLAMILLSGLAIGCNSTSSEISKGTKVEPSVQQRAESSINVFGNPGIQLKLNSLTAASRESIQIDFSKYDRTILYFWASWDQTSSEHLRDFDLAAKESKGKTNVIAVNVFENTTPGASETQMFESSANAASNAAKDYSLSIPMACYGDRLAKEWSIGGVPTFVVVDREAKLVGAQSTVNRDIIRKAVLQ